jgi:hypothetical protein
MGKGREMEEYKASFLIGLGCRLRSSTNEDGYPIRLFGYKKRHY